MNDSSRTQGVAICVAAAVLGLIFGIGLLTGSWWAVAIPVGLLLAFVLGLTFWVGYTIATIDVEPEAEPGTTVPPSPPAAPDGDGDSRFDSDGDSDSDFDRTAGG